MKRIISLITILLLCLFFIMSCKEEELIIFFDSNGGTGTMKSQIFIKRKPQTLLPNAFTKNGYTFLGWCTNSDGAGDIFYDQQKVKMFENTILYAQWNVTDIEGNIYNTVQIGSQCWMKENLKTRKYKTGEVIPIITDYNLWGELTNGAMCYYNNIEGYATKYGALYNGYTVLTGNLCPDGWHVPSSDDWDILVNHLGGYEVAGYKMKTTYDWKVFNGMNSNGNNESGFTAYPAGKRGVYYTQSHYNELNYSAYFWTLDEYLRVGKLSNNSGFFFPYYSSNAGYSVRCVKD